MIGEYTLFKLCQKYNIDSNKIVNKNNNILNYGEYEEINKTLNYLINVLKISPNNIEKCPSILYKNVNIIEENMNFIKKTNINFSNIESCLHVLSTYPNDFKNTYEYVTNNYSLKDLNRNTSILSVNVNIIKSVEKLRIPFINKNGNLTIAVGIGYGIQDINGIEKIIESKEFKEHPELFTSQVLARSSLEEIKKIVESEEFKEHPELFTSEVLAHSSLEEIKKIIESKEFKEYPELFTSTVLAHSSLEEIKNIIGSEEFKEWPELFTSQVLAHAKINDISLLLSQPYWKDLRFKHLLTSSIIAKSKLMIEKIPKLIRLSEEHNIDKYLTQSFLLKSISQNYALIIYLENNNIPLVINEKLNPVFNYQPGALKKNYNIDIKELMKLYPLEEENQKEGAMK